MSVACVGVCMFVANAASKDGMWNRDAVTCLIDLCIQNDAKLKDRNTRKKTVWAQIAATLANEEVLVVNIYLYCIYGTFCALTICACCVQVRRRRHHRVASSGRPVALPWPRRMACLQRLAGTDPVSFQS